VDDQDEGKKQQEDQGMDHKGFSRVVPEHGQFLGSLGEVQPIEFAECVEGNQLHTGIIDDRIAGVD